MPLFRAPPDTRVHETPAGAVDGVNDTYTTADPFCHNPTDETINVFRNGVLQTQGDDYTVSESGGPGTGFDTITFAVGCIPKTGEVLRVDYVAD